MDIKATANADLTRALRQNTNMSKSLFLLIEKKEYLSPSHKGEPKECSTIRKTERFSGLSFKKNCPSFILLLIC